MVNGRYSVGVIGCGVIGGALIKWLEEYNKNVDVLRVDPPKGMNDDISKADIVFVSSHFIKAPPITPHPITPTEYLPFTILLSPYF